MKCIGTMAPLASLRGPVSIGCSIRMRTSAVSTCSVARIFIGSDILCSFSQIPGSQWFRADTGSAATADGDFDFLDGGVKLAVSLDHRAHVRGLAHFEPGRNVALGAVRDIESGTQGERIFLGNDRNALGIQYLAGHRYGYHGAVFGDVRGGDGDVFTLDQIGRAEILQRVGDRFRFECGFVPARGQCRAAFEQAGADCQCRARKLEKSSAQLIHRSSYLSGNNTGPAQTAKISERTW